MIAPFRLADPEAIFLVEERRVAGQDAIAWECFDVARFDPALVETARVGWTRRLLGEYQSLVTLSALAARMAAANEPVAVTAAALRMAQDELRHAELCGRMADLLGGRVAVALTPHRPRAHLDEEVLAMLCIDESLSLSYLEAGHHAPADPVVHAVGDALLRDEVFHARCGWAWLQLQSDEWAGEDRGRLSACATEALRLLAGLESNDPQPAGDGAIALGYLPPAARRAAFRRGIDEWILPGLAELGIYPES